MLRSWAKWCLNHNAKFLLYLVWFIVLPLYWLVFIPDAVNDAIYDLKDINKMKGE